MSTLIQGLLRGRANPAVHRYSRRHASDGVNQLFLDDPKAIGVAITQSAERVLQLSMATATQVVIVDIPPLLSLMPKDEGFKTLLSGKAGQPILVGFSMPRLALHLQGALQMHVRGVDLSTVVARSTKEPMYPSEVFGKFGSWGGFDHFAIDSVWHENDGDLTSEEEHKLCCRAWLSVVIASEIYSEVQLVRKVDTRFLKASVCQCLRTLLLQSDALEKSKPKETVNDFSEARLEESGSKISIQNSRYKTRVRVSKQAKVIMTNTDGEEFTGSARTSQGKRTSVNVARGFTGQLARVRIIGKEQKNNAEKYRDELVLLTTQNEVHLPHAWFIALLWFPKQEHIEELCSCHSDGREVGDKSLLLGFVRGISLNESQRSVVMAMASDSPRLMITHGPPGTGKTSTIAATAQIWTARRSRAWIVAHSNVAVKNIAEKLAKSGVPFKIIVSKEFYVEWHEHLYSLIESCTLRADELPDKPDELRRVLDSNTSIILSTLSMLLNPAFDQNGIFTIVPVAKLVVDPIFWKFRQSLDKVCFFGDPKQLPPYGADTAKLKSIFQVGHLVQDATFFLDTQYRMPTPLGDFISQEVYAGRLKSVHPISTHSSVCFVDVQSQIDEEEKSGLSWINRREVRTIAHLVASGYKNLNFCVITPYDAQRVAIEQELKNQNLPGWDKIYNIDSYQGNEADFVLVSVVRSRTPGFLRSENRLNVMLTRCRRGLVIVTSRSFIQKTGAGNSTMVARLVRHWEYRFSGRHWIDWREIATLKASLPGISGSNPISKTSHVQCLFPDVSSVPAACVRAPFDTKKLFAANQRTSPASTQQSLATSFNYTTRSTLTPSCPSSPPAPTYTLSQPAHAPSYSRAPRVDRGQMALQASPTTQLSRIKNTNAGVLSKSTKLDDSTSAWTTVSTGKSGVKLSNTRAAASVSGQRSTPSFNRYQLLRNKNTFTS